MNTFIPLTGILPAAQQGLWPELRATPQSFTLYGGTGLALRLGHRTSIDFDFFGWGTFDPEELANRVPYLRTAERIQVAPNTLTCRVNRDEPVLVSFFGNLNLGQVAERQEANDAGIFVASLLDLAGTKMAVIQKRAEWKDYIDIDALLQSGLSLSTALAAARIVYGKIFNPLINLKALSFFDDLPKLDDDVKARLRSAVAFDRCGKAAGVGSYRATAGIEMKPLPISPSLLRVAERVVWFENPEEALASPAHFLAYVMTYGTVEDVAAVREALGIEVFERALDEAPPGVFDARSWAYWNLRFGRVPTPPMPVRFNGV